MAQIDLNCDMGESFGAWAMGHDAALMPYITSANVACGFHAGDAMTMRTTVRLALAHGVAIGAHPGFPDLQGFGRRNMHLSAEELYAMTLYQIGALQAIVRAEGGHLHHVKPHGALYNMAAKDRTLADAIAQAVHAADPTLVFYGLSGSALIAAGQSAGLRTASEVFADRTYQPDGTLTARTATNALIEHEVDMLEQVLDMVHHQQVRSTNGSIVSLQAQTICLHGDGPHAASFARTLFEALAKTGVQLKTP